MNLGKLIHTRARTHMTPSTADAAQDSQPITAPWNEVAGARVAILTDGMMRKCLSAIRALGKAGFRVHVLGDSWLTVGFWSHFTQERLLVPEAKENSDGYGKVLVAHLRSLAATKCRPAPGPCYCRWKRTPSARWSRAPSVTRLRRLSVPEPEALRRA